MHDIKAIRKSPKSFDKEMKRRGIDPIADEILRLDESVREGKTNLQELQEQSNHYAKKIGELKSQGKDASKAIEKSKEIKAQIASIKKQDDAKDDNPADAILKSLPNTLFGEVPDGESEDDNVEVRKWGEPKDLDFKPKQHFEIGEELGMMDFEQSAKISGSRFVTLSGKLAKLERILSEFMLELHTNEYGYEEVSPPILVRDDAMFGSGQLPKFEEDSFVTTNEYRLIPTSEVSLVNLVREKILDEKELPKRYVAYTPCFRSEAGAAGKDTRGMLRQHQFWKVEMVSITDQGASKEEHERITTCAEQVLKLLNIPYRVMLLCSKDTGFCSHKTYDIEAWLPGQETYREISSCSNCGDFQARRMKARYKTSNKENKFVHTLNGSGLAVGRTLIAVIENYQNKDGSITVPEVLRDRMGCDVIK